MGEPSTASLLGAAMVSSLKTSGYLETPGLKIDGIKAMDELRARGGADSSKAEAIESAIHILRVSAERLGIEWMTKEQEKILVALLEETFDNFQAGNPELIRGV